MSQEEFRPRPHKPKSPLETPPETVLRQKDDKDETAEHELLKVKNYIRYADDFVCLSRDREYLVSLLPQINIFLKDQLHLELHPDKVSIETVASGVDFLGWVHFPQYRVLRTTTKKRMLRSVLANPKPAVICSYLGMLVHGNTHKLTERLEILLD